jgi:hypothetical protein
MKSRRQSSAAAGEGTTHSGGGGWKMERKDVEKNRRLHMKGLCLKLSSLIPPSAAKRASLLSPPACSNPNKVQYCTVQLFFFAHPPVSDRKECTRYLETKL